MRYNMLSDYYRQQKEKQIEQELLWLEQETLYVQRETNSLASSTRKTLQYLRKRDKNKMLKSKAY